MSGDEREDLPTALTALLRNVAGVHTVYATRAPIPTLVTAVVEAVKNEPVGVQLVTVAETDEQLEVTACIGVLEDEPAVDTVRRAHDAIDDFLVDGGELRERIVCVKVGRVG